MNASNVNKDFALSKFKAAAKTARELLEVSGEEQAYYDWHNQTIEACRKAMGEIILSPDTNWN